MQVLLGDFVLSLVVIPLGPEIADSSSLGMNRSFVTARNLFPECKDSLSSGHLRAVGPARIEL